MIDLLQIIETTVTVNEPIQCRGRLQSLLSLLIIIQGSDSQNCCRSPDHMKSHCGLSATPRILKNSWCFFTIDKNDGELWQSQQFAITLTVAVLKQFTEQPVPHRGDPL